MRDPTATPMEGPCRSSDSGVTHSPGRGPSARDWPSRAPTVERVAEAMSARVDEVEMRPPRAKCGTDG